MWIGKKMKKSSRESTVMRGTRPRLFTWKTDKENFDPMEQAVIDDMLSDLPKVRMARYATRALRTGKRAEYVDYDRLRRIFGGVSEETINKTLAATTHMVQWSGLCHYISDIRRSSNSFAIEG